MAGTDKFKFDVIVKTFKTAELKMMRELAMAHKNEYLNSFKMQSWDGKKWKEVNRRTPGTKEYEYPAKKKLSRRTKPILVQTGALRRGVNASIKMITPKKVFFRVDLPYAKVHNEGKRMKGGGKMPKRQFMGVSKRTDQLTKQITKKYVDKAFKSNPPDGSK